MRNLLRTSFLATAALCTAGFAVWPGCAAPLLPASRTPLTTLRRTDFAFTQGMHPTRHEIIQRLGTPTVHLPDLRIEGYTLDRVKQRELWIILVLPVAAPLRTDELETAVFAFDAHDRMTRFGVIKSDVHLPNALHLTAEAWLKGKVTGELPKR